MSIQYDSSDSSVKSISTLDLYLPSSETKTTVIASCSSDGKINVYDLAAATAAGGKDIEPLASYDTEGSRLICVTLADDAEPASAVAPDANENQEPGARFEDDEDEDEDEEEGMYEDSQEEDEEEEEDELEQEDEDEMEED